MSKFKLLLLAGAGIALVYFLRQDLAAYLPKLILLLTAVVCFFIVRQYIRARIEREARLSPSPPKAVIEIRVPRDLVDANSRMKRVNSQLASATTAEADLRRQGIGQIDFLYLIERPPDYLTPILRFFIVCDPLVMPRVKRAIKTAFERNAQVFNIDEDPLGDVVEQLRAIALAEAGQEKEETPDLEEEASLEVDNLEEKVSSG